MALWSAADTFGGSTSLKVSLSILPVNGTAPDSPCRPPGAGIAADVEGFVDRHEERDGVRNLLVGDFLAVHLQHAGAALAEAGSVVGEVEDDGVLTGRERVWRLPAGSARDRGSCR